MILLLIFITRYKDKMLVIGPVTGTRESVSLIPKPPMTALMTVIKKTKTRIMLFSLSAVDCESKIITCDFNTLTIHVIIFSLHTSLGLDLFGYKRSNLSCKKRLDLPYS